MARRRKKRAHSTAQAAGTPAEASAFWPNGRGLNDRALGLLIIAGAILAYLSALNAGFIWDDPEYLTENPLVLGGLSGLGRIWIPFETVQYYPLVFSTFWAEHALWGLAPFGYHLVNVLLHAGSALLVWRILRRLDVPGAWLAAAIFAVHPVHMESVAWVTERKNVLSGLFYLLALRQYLIFDEGEENKNWGRALVFFALALLSKTVTASLPVAILILLWMRGRPIGKAAILRILPFFILGAAGGLFTAWIEIFQVGAFGEEFIQNPIARLTLAGLVPWFYLGKLLFPYPLIFSYPRWAIDPAQPLQWLGLAGMALAALFLWRRREKLGQEKMGRGPAAAALFFLFTLGPVLGFLNVYPMRFSYVADHFQYLASLGPIALFAGAAAALWQKRAWGPRAGAALAALLLIALGALSYRQGLIYKNAETLWRDTVAKNPASWMAQNHLGRILAARGDLAGAMARYRAALKVKPAHAYSLNNLGNALLRMGKKAEAAATLRRAVAADPSYANARNSLGRALLAAGKVEAAIEALREALRINPRFAPAHSNLGMALMQKGAAGSAVAAFRQAVEISPGLMSARYNLAIALSEMKKYGEAIAALRPGAADKKMAELLAWLLATSPDAKLRDGQQALRLIEGSLRGKRVGPRTISIFAAALAETGQFRGAAEAAREAAAMAARAGNAKNAALYRSFAEHYAAGKPYRLPAP